MEELEFINEAREVMGKYGKDFKRLLKKSRDEGVEYGFIICRKDGKLIKRGICNGEACRIALSPFCKEKEKKVATFHTHTFIALPSATDVFPITEKIGCIGERRGFKVRCFDNEDIAREIERKTEMKEDVMEGVLVTLKEPYNSILEEGMKKRRIKYLEMMA